MKKIVLTMVAMLSMTMAFAEGENVNSINEMDAYNLTINSKKLSETLGLSRDQAEAVADIEKQFSAEMMNIGEANKESRPAMLRNTLKTNLGYMHMVLSEKQYRKYLMLLNMTLTNRGLNF